MASIPSKVKIGNYIITSCLGELRKARVNQAKILHDVHRIRHSVWSLIAMGSKLRGLKDGTWQAEAMTWMLLVRGYYADYSQASSKINTLK